MPSQRLRVGLGWPGPVAGPAHLTFRVAHDAIPKSEPRVAATGQVCQCHVNRGQPRNLILLQRTESESAVPTGPDSRWLQDIIVGVTGSAISQARTAPDRPPVMALSRFA